MSADVIVAPVEEDGAHRVRLEDALLIQAVVEQDEYGALLPRLTSSR